MTKTITRRGLYGKTVTMRCSTCKNSHNGVHLAIIVTNGFMWKKLLQVGAHVAKTA